MEIINGDLVVDDRGIVTFVNDFNFAGVKRFYMVENHKRGFIRAWHGHEREAKYVFVVSGAIRLGVVDLGAKEDPDVYTLSSSKPQILRIPQGYANGFQTLTDDAKVIFYSTSTLEESKGDDIRFPAKQWNIWGDNWR